MFPHAVYFSRFGTRYTFGSAARMGIGCFLTGLGIIPIVLGAVIPIVALSPKAEGHHVAKFFLSNILLIMGSVVLFGMLSHRSG